MTIQFLPTLTSRHNIGPIDIPIIAEVGHKRVIHYQSISANFTTSTTVGNGTIIFDLPELNKSYFYNMQCVGSIWFTNNAVTGAMKFPILFEASSGMFRLGNKLGGPSGLTVSLSTGSNTIYVWLDIYLGSGVGARTTTNLYTIDLPTDDVDGTT